MPFLDSSLPCAIRSYVQGETIPRLRFNGIVLIGVLFDLRTDLTEKISPYLRLLMLWGDKLGLGEGKGEDQ